jgi:hypothetical protein
MESLLVAEAARNKMTMSTNIEIQPLLSRISNGRPNIGAWLDTVKFSILEELEQENRVKELKRENRRDGEGHHSPPLASVTHYSTYPASSSGLACPCCMTTCGEEDNGPILVGTFVCGPEGMMEQTMDFCQQKSDEAVRLVGHPQVYRL